MLEPQISIEVRETTSLSPSETAGIQALFASNYDQADPGYIDKSLRTFSYIAVAMHSGSMVGFGFGETRIMPLPRLSETEVVAFAGMSCVDPSVRQRGLFSLMAAHVLGHDGKLPSDRPYLFCGRMAHALSYRTISKQSPACVPSPGATMSSWHRDVLLAAAEALGVVVNPESGVVRGAGKPIGFPKIDFEPTPAEQSLFNHVDRARGDSLLTIAWLPQPPPGW